MSLWNHMTMALDPAEMLRAAGYQPDEAQTKVLRSTAKTTMLNCCRQFGKSTVGGARAIHKSLFKPRSTTVIISPTQDQSAELLERAKVILYTLDETGVETEMESTIRLELSNRSRIFAMPGSETSIRGYSPDLLILDEASRIPDPVYIAAMGMLAATNGEQLIMSTPAGKRGFFYDLWFGDPTIERVEVPATKCSRISTDFLEAQRRRTPVPQFEAEFMCKFLDNDGLSIFTTELLEGVLGNVVPV